MAATTSPHHDRRLFEHIIPHGVAVLVVVMLEIVNVKNKQRHPLLLCLGPGNDLPKKLSDVTAILQPRQIVLRGEFFELADSVILVGK